MWCGEDWKIFSFLYAFLLVLWYHFVSVLNEKKTISLETSSVIRYSDVTVSTTVNLSVCNQILSIRRWGLYNAVVQKRCGINGTFWLLKQTSHRSARKCMFCIIYFAQRRINVRSEAGLGFVSVVKATALLFIINSLSSSDLELHKWRKGLVIFG